MDLRESVWSMLVLDEVGSRDGVVASIRQAMLDAMDELSSPDVRALDDTVSSTVDIAGLWNLRTDLTNAIAAEQDRKSTRLNSSH